MSPEEETVINRNTMKLQDHLYKALKQRDQYKAERDNCLKDINQLRKALIKKQNLADELMEYQVNYINLTNHIRQKAENNPNVDRYIALVNYIDRLESE